MAARRSVQGITESLHGLVLSSPQSGRMAGLTSRVVLSLSPSASSQNGRLSSVPASHQPIRSFSTSPVSSLATSAPSSPSSTVSSVTSIADRAVPVTVFAFPSLEPRSLEMWSAQHLHLPLRRDLLHLAVVYEGDNTRQGTASSKTRFEVHGSHRKMRPQKGTGQARIGTRQSPMLRGGGKVFGPKPRDFGTDLNRKVYDRAWRTALSYRYRRGELFVCEDGMELPLPEAFLRLAQEGALERTLEDGFVQRYVRTLLNGTDGDIAESGGVDINAVDSSGVTGIVKKVSSGIGSIGQAWGRAAGRTTFITTERRPNLFTSLETAGEDGRALEVCDVDVKDLLETGRLVVERAALREMIARHQSDLVSRVFTGGARPAGPAPGRVVVE